MIIDIVIYKVRKVWFEDILLEKRTQNISRTVVFMLR